MKNKLEDAYEPDKQGRKEKVVIGLTGGIDSLVTAYLLKIQKYDLIAVTILNSWEDLGTVDGENIFSCHINQSRLELIKNFCNRLNIPLQEVRLTSEFKEFVVEPWAGDKVLGRRPKTCWNCHELRMNILHEKMLEAGAKIMATGHYAKLFQHAGHGTVYVHTSNDEANDQSALLSRLSHDILSSLLLPLSDLTKKEVLKLAENFGISEVSKKVPFKKCLTQSSLVEPALLKIVPPKFIKEGEISNEDQSMTYGNHEGFHTQTLGDEFVVPSGVKSAKGYIGSLSYPDKRMTVVDQKYFNRQKALIVNCRFSEEIFWPEPTKAFLVLENEVAECWVYPKTLSSVYIELTEAKKLIPDSIISLTKKKGRNAKVILTGIVRLLPEEPQDEVKDEKEEGDEGDEGAQKDILTLDY